MTSPWIFGTDGIRGAYGRGVLVPHRLAELGWLLGHWIQENSPCNPLVVMGMDTRQSSPIIVAALCSGLKKAGVSVHFVGCCPTAAVSFLTSLEGGALGLMVSASHNPAPDNGIKFFGPDGAKWSPDTEQIFLSFIHKMCVAQDILIEAAPAPCNESLQAFVDFLLMQAPPLCAPLTLVVDAAHGAYAGIATKVLTAWGATVVHTIGHAPDGDNINDKCGAVYPQALCEAVRELQADAGIAFDGDGDRVVVINKAGEPQNGDQLLAALSLTLASVSLDVGSEIAHSGVAPGVSSSLGLSTGICSESSGGFSPLSSHNRHGVVGTIVTNSALESFLAQRSLSLDRTHVGDRWVQQRLHQLGWTLGGEPSGHVLVSPLLRTGDGLLAGMHVLSMVANQPSLFPCFVPHPTATRSIPVRHKGFVQTLVFEEECKHAQDSLSHEYRLIIRPSGTEPVIRVLLEGPSLDTVHDQVDRIVNRIMLSQEAFR